MSSPSQEETPHDYNYKLHGFDWKDLANCDGKAQSPVNLVTSKLMDPKDRTGVSGIKLNGLLNPSFKLSNIKVNIEQDMKLSFDAPTEDLPTISVDGKEEAFKPIQLHFHHFVSEHAMDGQYFAAESHLVMSSQSSDKLAVLGTLFKIDDETEGDDLITRWGCVICNARCNFYIVMGQ